MTPRVEKLLGWLYRIVVIPPTICLFFYVIRNYLAMPEELADGLAVIINASQFIFACVLAWSALNPQPPWRNSSLRLFLLCATVLSVLSIWGVGSIVLAFRVVGLVIPKNSATGILVGLCAWGLMNYLIFKLLVVAKRVFLRLRLRGDEERNDPGT